MNRRALVMQLVALTLATASCDQRMGAQPRYDTYEAGSRFPNRQSALPHVAGTVPISGADISEPPRTITLMRRGEERYEIYCLPCHGALGNGDGRVVREFGFPAPRSLHTERLRNVDDRKLWDVITYGYGLMYPYGSQLSPQDRWAVVAYLRALQLSQHAVLAEHPSLADELTRRGLQ